MMRMVDMPMLDKNVSVAGLTVVGPDLMGLVLPKYIKPLRELGRYFDRSLVIFTTFFGLDKAVSLPPNFKLIGPSYEPPTPNSPKTLSPDLTQFLEKASSSKKPIVYVTFGSVLQLTQQFIKHLYEGLKKTDLAVIWSLRSG
jgi:UDP:flavonoid glycosyltransferase YjiC (YdhE family)